MKQVAGDLHRRLVGLQTENVELTDFFDAEIRWPLSKASLPLWQRHGRLSMPPIIVLVNVPEQILCYIRVSIILPLNTFDLYFLQGLFLML
jgi:hypothetical protein